MEFVRMRKSERRQLIVACCALVVIVATSAYVVAAQRRTDAPVVGVTYDAIESQRQLDHLDHLDARVKSIEGLDVGPRLRVLEDMKARTERIEMLAWGQIVSGVSMLFLSIMSLRSGPMRRRQA
jgi:hypothetical protein